MISASASPPHCSYCTSVGTHRRSMTCSSSRWCRRWPSPNARLRTGISQVRSMSYRCSDGFLLEDAPKSPFDPARALAPSQVLVCAAQDPLGWEKHSHDLSQWTLRSDTETGLTYSTA